MPNLVPKTFYEFLMLLNEHRLKVGPVEAFKEERYSHALGRNTVGRVSYGMWDHKTNAGFIDLDRVREHQKAAVKDAPAIPDGDKEWDL